MTTPVWMLLGFAAWTVLLLLGNVGGALVSALAVAILAARVLQSLVHVAFEQTNTVASIRFAFFLVQIVCFLWLIAIVVSRLD